MTRFGLANMFTDISYGKFMRMAHEFRRAVEVEFGTECDVSIDLLTRTKTYISIIDDEWQGRLDRQNDAARIARLDKLSDLTPALWRQAGYVEMNIRPRDEAAAPQYAFAHMEAKGAWPLGLCFYVQGGGMDGGESVLAEMRARHRFMSLTDGMDGNSTNTLTRHPSYLSFFARI